MLHFRHTREVEAKSRRNDKGAFAMSIEAIDSILDHILDGFPETPSCLCGDAGSHMPSTPHTLDDVVDHLVSGALIRPARPVLHASSSSSSGPCAPCVRPLS